MSFPADIYFEESKINDQLLGECYWSVISFSFISRMAGIIFPISNIVELTLGSDCYWFVKSFFFIRPVTTVFFSVRNIVEQKLDTKVY